ncbi:MAG TPA: hypothetical protein DCY94_04125, partial [Firmicutes bacterium]|nr:hypothetical protein [Bacillota bacterium]
MNEKTNIIYADGRQVQADLICYIENVANNKRYVYYTLNETVGTGANSTVKIYVANIKMNNPALDTEITADEWGTLKGYMGDALKDNANPNIRYISPAEMGPNVTIVSDRAIAMPISYDYINKQRGIYATAIAVPTAEPSAPATSEPVPEVSEPTPAPEPAPVVEPTPMIQETPAPQPETVSAPATEPSPTIEPADTSVSNEQPVPLADTTNVGEEIVQENVGNAPQLEPIDIDAIEAKYKE